MAQNEKNPKFVGTVDGIIRNCVFDFGCFLNMDITNEVMEGLSQKSDNIVSGLTSNGNRVKGILRRLIKDFEGD